VGSGSRLGDFPFNGRRGNRRCLALAEQIDV
jgi:hypothetical protein